jgi:uncharacterized protein (TIGR03086 family)
MSEAGSAPPRLTPLEALDRAQTTAAALIARIDDDDWQRPTPCDEWSVRDIVNKMVASTEMFAWFGRRQRLEPPHDLVHPPELIGDDPLGIFQTAAAECRSAWRAPDALAGEAPSTVGRFPATAVLNARIFDTTILTWDVARAVGLPHGIDDRLAAYVLRVARALVTNVRSVSPDRYKDPTELGDDSPWVDRMVAATGRDPNWSPPGTPSVALG